MIKMLPKMFHKMVTFTRVLTCDGRRWRRDSYTFVIKNNFEETPKNATSSTLGERG